MELPTISPEQAGGEPLVRFLNLIAHSEGTSTHPLTQNNGYDVIVSSVDGPEIFTDYSDHPFAHREANVVRRVPLLRSSAAGRYQLLYRYWTAYRDLLKLRDFSPLSQDLVALKQVKERKATSLILDGNIEGAIIACSNIWASFPSSPYHQPGGKSMADLLQAFSA